MKINLILTYNYPFGMHQIYRFNTNFYDKVQGYIQTILKLVYKNLKRSKFQFLVFFCMKIVCTRYYIITHGRGKLMIFNRIFTQFYFHIPPLSSSSNNSLKTSQTCSTVKFY